MEHSTNTVVEETDNRTFSIVFPRILSPGLPLKTHWKRGSKVPSLWPSPMRVEVEERKRGTGVRYFERERTLVDEYRGRGGIERESERTTWFSAIRTTLYYNSHCWFKWCFCTLPNYIGSLGDKEHTHTLFITNPLFPMPAFFIGDWGSEYILFRFKVVGGGDIQTYLFNGVKIPA